MKKCRVAVNENVLHFLLLAVVWFRVTTFFQHRLRWLLTLLFWHSGKEVVVKPTLAVALAPEYTGIPNVGWLLNQAGQSGRSRQGQPAFSSVNIDHGTLRAPFGDLGQQPPAASYRLCNERDSDRATPRS